MTDPTTPQQPGVPPTPPQPPVPPTAAPQPPAAPAAPAQPAAPQAAPPANPYQAPAAQPAPPAPGNPYQAPPAQPAQGNPYQAAPGQPNPYQQQGAATPGAPLTEAEDKQWASFAHFGGVIGFLPALIIFLVFKDRGARTRVEAKEALNWQITWTAGSIILAILVGILNAILWAAAPWQVYTIISGLLGFITWVPWLLNVIFSIIGGVRVNGGGAYRYPFAIRLIK